MKLDKFLPYRKGFLLNKIICSIFSLYSIDLPVKVVIGEGTSFRHNAPGTVIHESTKIGKGVKIYQNCTIGRGDVDVSPIESTFEGVIIKDNAILSAGCKILCSDGVLTIGENVIVAANAVVLQSIPDNEVWGGIPARKISVRKSKPR